MKIVLCAVAAAGVVAACAAAPDEAWIRITRVLEDDTAVTVVRSDLRDSGTDTVDVEVENFATIVGSGGDAGVGIQVYRARVEYRLGDFDFPDYEYPVTLYLPPLSRSDSEGAATGQSTGVIPGLPIAPATLKGWILNPGNFPRELLRQPVRLEAKIIVRGRTEEGRELDTSTAVSVEFTSDIGGGSEPDGGETAPSS